jgi:amidophosphoribosyltransferase
VLASETCALDHIGASFVREVAPGEIVRLDSEGLKSYPESSERNAMCIFEYIYFARPDSVINGRLLYDAREAMAPGWPRNNRWTPIIVVGVPDSANPLPP